MSRTKEAIEMLKEPDYDIHNSIFDTLETMDPEADPEDTYTLTRMLEDIIYDEMRDAALRAIFDVESVDDLPPGVTPGRKAL